MKMAYNMAQKNEYISVWQIRTQKKIFFFCKCCFVRISTNLSKLFQCLVFKNKTTTTASCSPCRYILGKIEGRGTDLKLIISRDFFISCLKAIILAFRSAFWKNRSHLTHCEDRTSLNKKVFGHIHNAFKSQWVMTLDQ